MDKEIADKILRETEIGYDLVSDKFSATRKFFWRGMEFIGDYAKDGDTILDFGCGNGRLLELFNDKKIEYLGVDPSQKLIDFAQSKYSNTYYNTYFFKINPGLSSTKIVLNDNTNHDIIQGEADGDIKKEKLVLDFNTIYSIAVFHHFPSCEYRKRMAEELYRVTKKNGQIIITVWNLWQRKYIKNIANNYIDKLLRKSSLDWHDCYITFKNNEGQVFSRFHHAFTKKELQKLFESVGFRTEVCKIINGRNIIFIGKK